VEGIAEACRALDTPVVSGNVSFYNETKGRAIFPTPVVAMVGLLEDATLFAGPFFRTQGDLIALLGEPDGELGGSEYLAAVHGVERGRPARLDWAREKAVQAACREGIVARVFRSAHDCAEGGLAVALAECCVGGPEGALGAEVSLPGGLRPDAILFGEAPSRILLSLDPADREKAERIVRDAGAPFAVIGRVGGERLRVNAWIDLPVAEIGAAWRGGLARALREGG